MAERSSRGGNHFPLTIDTLGGVTMTSGVGRAREISYQLGRVGRAGLAREVAGSDWRLSSGEGTGRIDFQAKDDSLTVTCYTPQMVFEYSRGGGSLKGVLISGLDLVALAGIKLLLAPADMTNIDDRKTMAEDTLISLTFEQEGLRLAMVNSEGRELVGIGTINPEDLGANKYGFLPDEAQYSWTGNLGFLRGRVGFEVYFDKVVFFYEKDGKAGKIRQNVMEVPRNALGTAAFDWAVTQAIPSEDQILTYMEEIYLPLL